MKITWATDISGIGNTYGYAMQNRKSREAIQAAGVEIVPDADIVLHIAPGHLFEPVRGRLNVLYTCWEMDVLPERYVNAYDKADALILSASYLQPVVAKYLPDKTTHVCHLGVDTDIFYPIDRSRMGRRPFRFLWVGAPNARKGWELVLEAFRPFENDPRFELYIKTTVLDRTERHGNVIFDARDLPSADYTEPTSPKQHWLRRLNHADKSRKGKKESVKSVQSADNLPRSLVSLYHSAHCFVFPSLGEGFGLTMAEAMATGLPVIYTPWSSLTDLADETCAYPVRYKMIPCYVQNNGGLVSAADLPSADYTDYADKNPKGKSESVKSVQSADNLRLFPVQLAQADTGHLAETMMEVWRHYKRALKKGHRAAGRIAARFTWKRTGERLAQICEEICVTAHDSPLTTHSQPGGGIHGRKHESGNA